MKRTKGRLLHKATAVLLAAALGLGGLARTPATAQAADPTTVKIWTEKAEPPVITDYPEIIGCNSTTSQTVSATATGKNLSYQWQINRNDGSGFVDIPGETGAAITVTRPQAEQDGHLYKCVVSNAAGSAKTGGMELVVYNLRAQKTKEKLEEAL